MNFQIIIVPIRSHGGGGGGLTAALIFITLFIFMMYYATVFINFSLDDYASKKEFKKDLIPFRSWIRSFIKKYNDLN
jgi:hypothetical protein